MRLIVWMLMLPLLTACGWHLRGVTPLPKEYRVLHLQSQAGNYFNQQLRLQLTFNNVLLTEMAEDAPAILQVDAVDIEKRTLSVTSSGQVAEYELNGRVNARLLHIERNSEFPIQIKSRRRLNNDINNVVGTASEETKQRNELEKDLVGKLMRYLQKAKADAFIPLPADKTANQTISQPTSQTAGQSAP